MSTDVATLLAERIRRSTLPNEEEITWTDEQRPGENLPHLAIDGETGGPAGIGMNIVYREDDGREVPLRITVSAIQVRNHEPPLVMAHFREQGIPRTFEIDRIVSVVDFNGRVFDPRAIFSEFFGVSRNEMAGKEPIEVSWGRNRGTITPAAHLMAALALSDGEMTKEELGIALDFCVSLAPELDTEDGRDRVSSYIGRMRPNKTTIAFYVDQLKTFPKDLRIGFMESAIALVRADGVIDDAELDLMRNLSIELVGFDLND